MSDWTVGFLNDDARAEVEALADSLRASFLRIVQLIEAEGLERMREPYVKHLEGKLWEIRLKGRDGIARSVYVTAAGKRVVVLRTFVKKTQKTPPRELKLARARAKEIE
jgi:phage-related protein